MNPNINNISSAAARYRGVQVKTCSPLQLLVMLFDGAIRFIGEAESAMAAKDRARAGERIGKAHAIIAELAATLDRDQAPELCDNLLGEVVRALTPLREGFAGIAG
jgi:flagellar secretion chaperone FliS